MPKTPSEENGGPTTSFSPYGAKKGPKTASSTTSSVMMLPTTNRFCFSAFCHAEGSAGAGAGVAGSAVVLMRRSPSVRGE